MSSSGGTVPQSPVLQQFQQNASSSLSNFFSATANNTNPFSINCLNDSAKVKRCRQRVDAGEPRNNYPGLLMSQSKSTAGKRNENAEKDEDDESVDQQMEDNEFLLGNENQPSDFELSDEDGDESRQESTNEVPINLSSQPLNLLADLPILIKNDPTENRHSNNSAMSSSSSKRKRFQPQKQPVKLDDSTFNLNDELVTDDKFTSAEQKNSELSVDNAKSKSLNETKTNELSGLSSLQKELAGRSNSLSQQDALPGVGPNANNSSPYHSNLLANKMFMEMQRRMYASAFNHQQSQSNGRADEGNTAMMRDAIMKDFARFLQAFNEQFISTVQKMSSDFTLTETEKALLQQMKQQKEQKQQSEWRNSQTFGMLNVTAPNLGAINPLFNPLNMPYTNQRNNLLTMASSQSPLHSLSSSIAQQNPTTNSTSNSSSFANLLNNGSSNSKMSSGSGIFPNAISNFPPFNGFVNHSASNNLSKNDDGSPRKKRSKVTDSVRGPRSAVRDNGYSLPASSRSSPQPNGYFPPTMVSHPLYNNTSFKLDRSSQSPGNSDDFSDYGVEGSFSQSSTLTHVHLRKAKLMFFYTRYPSSSVLKSYFPDINFNKSNTAQLVKWFSNFREFYYMQMEKFAKQAIAEGITNADEIVVTSDSEIYKQLNQHYNRNNFINPPETLSTVIEETLKEFFRALQEGRDAEPSWKKSIYKIIQQLDEQIPECFKSPSFMVQLESNQP